MADTASVSVSVLTPSWSLTPTDLVPITGPLTARNTSQPLADVKTYDNRFEQAESELWTKYLGCMNTCFMEGNHYGGLRSRMSWAIRHGQPIGTAATNPDIHMYARGRVIVQRYLQWSKQNGYSAKAEHNTGFADVETLWILEKDQEAYNHMWASASRFSQQDPYVDLTGPATSPRQALVPLMVQSAAHRHGIPFKRPTHISAVGFDGSTGSWKGAGERIIGWIAAAIERNGGDGTLRSTAHNGNEAFLFNAWTATELFKWNANVEWNQTAFNSGKLLMDHMIHVYNTVHKPKGWLTLPYTTPGTYAANDLAGFYIWPSLVLWQETGDQKYYDFAMTNIRAANKAYMGSIKQFNQTYATLGEGMEALLSGVRWK
jgi:hypothetical protein